MPPQAKITRDMIVDAAFKIAQSDGSENINARTVSQKLGCSTQPVMYHFKTIEDLKHTVYQKADAYHTAYIMNFAGDNPMKEIGLFYIRFAQKEKHLFRFLFQSNVFSGKSIVDLITSEEVAPIITVLQEAAGISGEQAGTVFKSLFLYVHGYASMFANNALEYDEASISSDLDRLFIGALSAVREEVS